MRAGSATARRQCTHQYGPLQNRQPWHAAEHQAANKRRQRWENQAANQRPGDKVRPLHVGANFAVLIGRIRVRFVVDGAESIGIRHLGSITGGLVAWVVHGVHGDAMQTVIL